LFFVVVVVSIYKIAKSLTKKDNEDPLEIPITLSSKHNKDQ